MYPVERESQSAPARLMAQLRPQLPYMNFYRFCQLLEKRRPGQPLMGGTSHPADDPVRFYPHPGMGFPASELKAVEYDEADDSRPPVIRTRSRCGNRFPGRYGWFPSSARSYAWNKVDGNRKGRSRYCSDNSPLRYRKAIGVGSGLAIPWRHSI